MWVFVLGFSVVLEPRGRLGGKVGSACEESEDNKDVLCVNVSESSAAGSLRLSSINDH